MLSKPDSNSPPTHLILNASIALYRAPKSLGIKGTNAKARVVSLDRNPRRQMEPSTRVTDIMSHWMALWIHTNVYGRTFIFLLKRLFSLDR